MLRWISNQALLSNLWAFSKDSLGVFFAVFAVFAFKCFVRIGMIQYDPVQTLLQERNIEVDQKPERFPAQLQISFDLEVTTKL
jgi:hypothetical protein